MVVWGGVGVSVLHPRWGCCSFGLGSLADAGDRDILTAEAPGPAAQGSVYWKGRVRTVVVDVHPGTHLVGETPLSTVFTFPFLRPRTL